MLKSFFEKIKKNNPINKSRIIKTAYLIFCIFALWILGIFAAFYIFWWQFGYTEAIEFSSKNPLIFDYSSKIMILICFIFFAIFGNWIISSGIMFSLITIIMFINSEKMRSRNTPFIPEDLLFSTEAGTMGKLVNYDHLSRTLLLIFFILLFCFLLNKIIVKSIKINAPKWLSLVFRIFVIVLFSNMLISKTEYIRTNTDENYSRVDFLNTEINSYNQEENYSKNGFIIGTIFNIQPKKMKKPENYSKENIKKITEKYSKIAKKENLNKTNLKDENINIIFIMSESFIDPYLGDTVYKPTSDPIPFTRKMLNENPSGWAMSSEYGGGTANVEFEALTGLSNYFIKSMPYSTMLSTNKDAPSFSKFLKNHGYETSAIHPFSPSMYKRNLVYPNLGFDNFISESNLRNSQKIDNSQYISDKSTFDEALEIIDSKQKPQFIHIVTVQNHMPYDNGIYENTPFKAENISGDEEGKTHAETFFTGINKSDEAMLDFIEKINSSEEKTIVAFWGDHWPGFYGELFGKQKTIHDIHRTPLFIYKNFNEQNHENLGDTSLNYLQTETLKQINGKMSPFQYLVDELRKEVPALTKNTLQNEYSSEVFSDYKLIEYDILSSGEKWSLGDFYPAK